MHARSQIMTAWSVESADAVYDYLKGKTTSLSSSTTRHQRRSNHFSMSTVSGLKFDCTVFCVRNAAPTGGTVASDASKAQTQYRLRPFMASCLLMLRRKQFQPPLTLAAATTKLGPSRTPRKRTILVGLALHLV